MALKILNHKSLSNLLNVINKCAVADELVLDDDVQLKRNDYVGERQLFAYENDEVGLNIILTLFIACILAAIAVVITTLAVQMPFISKLLKIVAALIFAIGIVVTIWLCILSIRKSLHYLKSVIHKN